jgi:hypothetical protein
MNTLFDAAGLAIVAYADVASDGSSTSINSGITTSKTGTGIYNVVLPVGLTQQSGSDLVVVQALGTAQLSPTVDNSDAATKVIRLYSGSTLTDGEFNIIIFRALISKPSVAP